MEIVLFWLVLAIIVGVAANTRGRSGFGWFLLAAIISPLIAGLLLLALPRISGVAPKVEVRPPLPNPKPNPQPNPQPFEPDGVYAGIPYKVLPDAAVHALMSGTFVRFRTWEEFQAAATAATRQFDNR